MSLDRQTWAGVVPWPSEALIPSSSVPMSLERPLHPQVPDIDPGPWAAGPSKGVRKGRLSPVEEILTPSHPPVTRDMAQPAVREVRRGVLSLSLCRSSGIAVERRRREGVLGQAASRLRQQITEIRSYFKHAREGAALLWEAVLSQVSRSWASRGRRPWSLGTRPAQDAFSHLWLRTEHSPNPLGFCFLTWKTGSEWQTISKVYFPSPCAVFCKATVFCKLQIHSLTYF